MVLLTFKTLQNNKVSLEAEPSATIGSLKSRLETEHNMGAATLQKLIFQGRVLSDDSTVEQLNFGEKDFIVFMLSRAPAAPAAAPAPAPTPAELAPAPAAAAPAAAPAAAAPSTPARPAAVPAPAAAADVTTPVAAPDPAHQAAMTQLMDMGFEASQVELALRAAFNNVDRAVEYLFNGIPEDVLSTTVADAQMSPSPVHAQQGLVAEDPLSPGAMPNAFDAPVGGDTSGSGPLDFLRTQPQFQQLRSVVLQNPQLMQPLLQEISVSNPPLFQLINQHPNDFLRLLQEGVDDQQMVITVTPEERAVIERLMGLGFDRNRVLEAYLICDKNEELAANYLFEHGHDDDQ